MKISPRISISFMVVSLLVVILSFSGFITNFISFTSKSLSTILIDALVLVLLGHTVVGLAAHAIAGKPVKKDYILFTCFWAVLLILSLFKVLLIDENPLGERFIGIRNNLLYSSFIIYIPLFFREEGKSRAVINLLLGLGIFLCLFSYFQFAFSYELPLSWLALRGEGAFSFLDEDFIRPTALLGNTIIFSSFTVILIPFFLLRFLSTKRIVFLLLLGLVVTANVLTYTRAALVGAALSSAIVLLLYYGRLSLQFILKSTAACLFFFLLIGVAGYIYKDSFIVRRVTGREVTTVYSTNDHYREIDNSIAYLKEKPLTGAGIGTQGPGGDVEEKIITDGFWFQVFLEHGLLLGSLFLLFYLSSWFYALFTFHSTKDQFLKEVCIAFVAFGFYFFLASFLNSALIGRVNQMVYWMIFGILLAQQQIVTNRKNALSSH